MPVAEIVGVVTATKSIFELAEKIKGASKLADLKDATKDLFAQVVDLNAIVAGLQAALDEERSNNRKLEEQIAQRDKWDADQDQYELTEPAPGVYTYRTKPVAGGVGPSPHLCAHCWEEKKKSMLQAGKLTLTGTENACPRCKSVFIFGPKGKPRGPAIVEINPPSRYSGGF